MARVTGLGGIFYKVADPAATSAWYKDNLGVGGEWGAIFPWAAEAGGEYGFDAVSRLQQLKTGALIAYSCAAGAILGRADDHQRQEIRLTDQGGSADACRGAAAIRQRRGRYAHHELRRLAGEPASD